MHTISKRTLGAALAAAAMALPLAGHAWEPTRTVEFIVPAGTGGGALQDACVWSATTTAPWVTITSTMPRQGDNPVAFTVAANTSSEARSATIVVQDRTVLIEQAGTP